MEILQPPTWPRPKGYSNGIAAAGRMVFLSGQIGFDETETLVSDHFVEQAGQALRNILTVLAEAGGGPEHLVRLTWFVTDRDAYLSALSELGKIYREVMGSHYPTMSLLVVSALVDAAALVEIEATAVIPEAPPTRD